MKLAADGDGGDERDEVEHAVRDHSREDAVRARPNPGEQATEEDDHRAGEHETVRQPEQQTDPEDRPPRPNRYKERVPETAEHRAPRRSAPGADDDPVARRTPPRAPAPRDGRKPLLVSGVERST